jgi:hypothetical protein
MIALSGRGRAGGGEVALTGLHEVSHDGAASWWRRKPRAGGETLRAKTPGGGDGGQSIPKMGATGAAYRIAERFGLR